MVHGVSSLQLHLGLSGRLGTLWYGVMLLSPLRLLVARFAIDKMHIQIHNKWEKQCAKIVAEQLTEEKVKWMFRKEYGQEAFFRFVGVKVEVSRSPHLSPAPPPFVFVF